MSEGFLWTYQKLLLELGECHSSNWSHIEVGVPQSLILEFLFFLAYINDLPKDLTTNAKLFADDVPLFFHCS